MPRRSPRPDPGPVGNTTGVRPQQPDAALGALARLLEPMAQLMIADGVQLNALVEALKRALVDAAVRHYSLEERQTSDTRIAILTGVHRKDVRRLRESPTPPHRGQPMPVASFVVGRWISEPRYLSADGQALRLARTPRYAEPGQPDFSSLVAEVSRDVSARAVLDELERLGVVAIGDDAHVELKAHAFMPPPGLQESFDFMAANVADHLASAVANLGRTDDTSAWLEQSAFSQQLTPVQARQLHQLARRLWGTALQKFLQSATVAEARSQGLAHADQRVRFGVYFHQETLAPADAAAAPPPVAADPSSDPLPGG